jgi:hypothetical protein
MIPKIGDETSIPVVNDIFNEELTGFPEESLIFGLANCSQDKTIPDNTSNKTITKIILEDINCQLNTF